MAYTPAGKVKLSLMVLIVAVGWMAAECVAVDLPETEKEKEKLSGRQIRVLRRQMQGREKEATAAYKNAETAFLVGQYDKAVEEFLAVAREYDDTSYRMKAVLRVGDVYYRQKKYERAISYYRRSLRVPSEPWWPEDSEKDYARADYMIGVCHFDQGAYNPMFAHFRRFVKKYPDSQFVDQAYNFIGRGNMRRERYGQAIEAFRMVGTANIGKKSGDTISPGKDMYLRVTDQDVALANDRGRIPVRVTTSSGDREMVYLESLGLGSPVFLGTIRTRLGAPRLTRALDEAYSADVRKRMENLLSRADRLEEEANRLRKKLEEVKNDLNRAERAAGDRLTGGNGEPTEAQKKARKQVKQLKGEAEELRKQLDELTSTAEQLKKNAYSQVDESFKTIEEILARWDVAQLAEKKGTEPEDEKDDGKQGEKEDKDEESKKNEDDLSDVFTPQQIARVRREVQETPTTDETYQFRKAVLAYWHEQLLREYKTLDLTGDAQIKVEYLDRHGSAEDKVQRTDTLGVASDVSVACLGPDMESSVSAVIYGDQVRVRVEDPDMDRSDKQDVVEVTISSVSKEKMKEEEKEEGEQEETEEEGEEQSSVDVMEMDENIEEEETKPPLVPEGAPSVTMKLKETDSHTGQFIGRLSTIAENEKSPAAKLELSPQRILRVAYADEKTSSREGSWVTVTRVDIVPGSEGEQEVIEKQESKLDRRSELEKGIALGKLARVYQDLGLKAEASSTFDEALKVVKEVVQAERGSALGEEATYQMWDLYFASGREEAAAEACNKLIKAFPESPLADNALLIMGKAAEEPKEAVKHYQRLVKNYPKSPLAPEAQYRMAETQRDEENFKVSAYEACANKFPGSNYAAKSLLRLAEYYIKTKDYDRAKEYLERVALDFPDFDRLDKTTYLRGVCAYRMGNIQLAYTLMHEVIEKYPGTGVAKSAGKIVKLLEKKLNK